MMQLLSSMHRRKAPLKDHGSFLRRPFLLLAVVVILLLAHGFTFILFLEHHRWLSSTFFSVVLILFVLKHVGLLGSFYALFRRRVRSRSN